MIRTMVMNEVPDFIIDAGPVPDKGIDPSTWPGPMCPYLIISVPTPNSRAGASGPSLIFGVWTGGNCTCGLPIP